MKRPIDTGNEQGRGPDRDVYAAADRARLRRAAPWLVVIVILVVLGVVYG